MAGPAVVFDHVWKSFRRGERHDSIRDLLTDLTRAMVRRKPSASPRENDFWAIRDVSFEVQAGEALGIIGPNGAGKSTTLKLLTRILKPNRGRCEVRGRIGALVEIAAGFHPDLTGRENIYLQGSIMGMKRAEISRKFDEIVDFSGVSAFIDSPVKRYSSGMNARLGFSIAAHLDPDVLIIDEVLSVGDMQFQRKCLQRMSEYKARGTAIVFVSHHLASITQLCQRALLLRNECLMLGPAAEVVHRYVEVASKGDAASDSSIRVAASLVRADGSNATECGPGDRLTLVVDVTAVRPIRPDVVFGVLCNRSEDNLVVYDANFGGAEIGFGGLEPGQSATIEVEFQCNLTRGSYSVGLNIYNPADATFLIQTPRLTSLRVFEERTFAGVADLSARVGVRTRVGA